MQTRETDAARECVVEATGIETRLGDELLHEDLDLSVFRGEIVGLVGASGSGKSVLLREVMGLQQPSAGRIMVLGHDVTADPYQTDLALRQRWGVLFQEGGLFSTLTVADNIKVPIRELTDFPDSIMDEIARVKIAMVGLPMDAAAKFPSELSGGMKRRAGLARAIALDPELLLLDEPTSGLDPITASRFDELIKSLQTALDMTVLMATHDIDSLTTVCDRAAVLVDKKLVVGTMIEMRDSADPWIHNFLCGPRGRTHEISKKV